MDMDVFDKNGFPVSEIRYARKESQGEFPDGNTYKNYYIQEGYLPSAKKGDQNIPKTETTWKDYRTQEGRQNAGMLNIKPFFLSKEFSDFVIQCGGKDFPVHKIILANKSPVFAKMFQYPLKEMQEGRLEIEDCTQQAFQEFLNFLYTGEGKLEENAEELFMISDKYCINELRIITETILVNKVSEENFLELFKLGKLLSSDSLTSKCYQMFKKKKKDIIKTNEDMKKFSDEYPDLLFKIIRGEM